MRSRTEIVYHLKLECVDVSLGRLHLDSILDYDNILQDLALDSLDYATIMLACERWLDIHIEEHDVDWTQLQTIAQLANFLYQCQQQP